MKLKRRGKIIQAHIKGPKGRTRISTGTSDIAEARRIAHDLEQIETNARHADLVRRAADAVIHGGKSMTAEKAGKQWLQWCRSVGLSEQTILKNETVLHLFLARWPELRSKPVSAITEDHVGAFVNDPGPTKASTRTRKLAAMRSMFKVWVAKAYVTSNPAAITRVVRRKLQHHQLEPATRRPFTEDQFMRLMASLSQLDDAFFARITAIGWATGLRLGDIVTLEWDQLSVPHHIVVWTEKRTTRVCLPINDFLTPGLAAALGEIPPNDSPFVFAEQAAEFEIPKKRSKLSVYFGRLVERAGLEGVSFHSLRHARITTWRSIGFSLEECAEFAGHRDTKTTKGYIHD